MSIIVTGGAGFIGSNFVLDWLAQSDEPVITLDKLTYAGNLDNLAPLSTDPRHHFVQGDIADQAVVSALLHTHRPRALINFAAETHVDRSIADPGAFVQANVLGTFHLLEAARHYWSGLDTADQRRFRFLHVSTDEVFGSLDEDGAPFSEMTSYAPNSPYSASKAASDHFVRAYHQTYGLPVLTSNCSNNYGPRQFPEKLIPLIIHNAFAGKPLPIYGDGLQRRDWLYVADHCDAIRRILEAGPPGATYNVGGWNEMSNLDLVRTLCLKLDKQRPRHDGRPYADQIQHVPDRAGHDRRYAVDASRLQRELGWMPSETFDSGIEKTVQWYLHESQWVANVASGAYRSRRHFTAGS